MSFGITALIAVIVVFILLKKLICFSIKAALMVVLALAAAGTIWIWVGQPELHKPFSIDTIEYLFKINKDGSMTTTKQTTHTLYKKQAD